MHPQYSFELWPPAGALGVRWVWWQVGSAAVKASISVKDDFVVSDGNQVPWAGLHAERNGVVTGELAEDAIKNKSLRKEVKRARRQLAKELDGSEST